MGTTTGRCPCCNGVHDTQTRVLKETIGDITFPVTYSYCPFTNEFYETDEQQKQNFGTYWIGWKRTIKKPYISQEKTTELLLKYEKRKGDLCTSVFIALQGQ